MGVCVSLFRSAAELACASDLRADWFGSPERVLGGRSRDGGLSDAVAARRPARVRGVSASGLVVPPRAAQVESGYVRVCVCRARDRYHSRPCRLSRATIRASLFIEPPDVGRRPRRRGEAPARRRGVAPRSDATTSPTRPRAAAQLSAAAARSRRARAPPRRRQPGRSRSSFAWARSTAAARRRTGRPRARPAAARSVRPTSAASARAHEAPRSALRTNLNLLELGPARKRRAIP